MTLQIITGGTGPSRLDALTHQAAAAAAAGVDLFQVREPQCEAAALAEIVAAVCQAVRGSHTRVLVNERLDIALAVGAHGVHLRASSMPAAAVRRLAPPGFLIGRSVHTPTEAAEAGPVDYVLAGTVLPSASKPQGHPTLGEEGLRAIVVAARVPVLAVGGLTVADVALVARAGAAGLAAIGLFAAADRLPMTVAALRAAWALIGRDAARATRETRAAQSGVD